MQVITREGHQAELPQDAVDAFRTRHRGPILVAGDPGYDDARTVWNGMIDRSPALVARCTGVADVVEAVRFARAHDLLVCVKGGGHNIAGLATADGALMLDLSPMRGVWTDAQRRVVHAQGGCLLSDVDRETQVHGLAAPLGFVSTTGIAGLTLGGGFGYLTRRHGWTVDNVVAFHVVTHDARVVRADAQQNPDLFWALRGGGGNFGVVTGIEYALHDVGPEVIGGMVVWPGDDAPHVLEFYRALAAASPPELTPVLILRPAPPAPWLPPEWHGKPIVALLACYSGDPEAGEQIVAPIKSFRKPIGDVLVRRPFTQVQALLDATQPKGRRYYWKSEYLADIAPAFCERMIEKSAGIPSPHGALIVFQLDGAIQRLDADHSPVGNRDARFVLNITAAWDHAGDDDANMSWARDAWSALSPFSTGGNYINFLTADEPAHRVEAALGRSLPRLREVKAKWDPHNVFRMNRNIQPSVQEPLP